MGNRGRLILVAALLAAAALLLWWGGRGPDRAGPRADRLEAAVPPPDAAPDAPDPEDDAQAGAPAPHRDPPRSARETHGDPEALGPIMQRRGRVTYDDGAPVEGALVVVSSSPIPAGPLEPLPPVRIDGVARSTADGSFEIPVAPGGHWKLLVRIGDDLVLVRDEPPIDDFLEIVLPREPTTLELEFVDAATGEPVVPRMLRLWLGSGSFVRWWKDHDRTSPIVRWSPAPAGTFLILTWFDGYEYGIDDWVEIRAGEITRKRIALHRGQVVRGTVLDDETGLGVRGGRVYVGLRDRPGTGAVSADASGRFELARMPWDPGVRRTLYVRVDGYSWGATEIGAVDEDGAVEEVEIRLTRPGTVLARCVDAEGRPLAHVVVRGRSFPPSGPMTLECDTAFATTRGDGRVELELTPGGDQIEVACWWRGVRCLDLTVDPLRTRERRDLGDLVIRQAATLRGVVSTHGGEPAAGATVVVEPLRDEDPDHWALGNALLAPVRFARCDSAGRFAIAGLQPGAWDLLVHGGGYPRLLHLGIAVRTGADPAPLDLRLPAALALEGRVVDAAGAPVAGAILAFQRMHPVPTTLMESVTTDADGRFSIPGFTADDEDVALILEGGRVEQVTPRLGPVTIVLGE